MNNSGARWPLSPWPRSKHLVAPGVPGTGASRSLCGAGLIPQDTWVLQNHRNWPFPAKKPKTFSWGLTVCFPFQTQLEQITEEQVGPMEEEMQWAPWMDPRAPTPIPLIQAGLRAPLLGRHLPVCSFAFRRAAFLPGDVLGSQLAVGDVEIH